MAEDKYVPPKSAQAEAAKAIRWKEEHGEEVKAMTRTGWVRARQLASGDELSFDVVKRMAQFNRHRKNSNIAPEYKSTPWKDRGYVAWLGWGGDAGVDWAIRMVEREEKKKTAASYPHKMYDPETGKSVTVEDEEGHNKYNEKGWVHEKPSKKSSLLDISARVAEKYVASKGNQTRRKDKDLMSDTGGTSKGRPREPHSKPPRDKNRYKPKRLHPAYKEESKDSDNPIKRNAVEQVEWRGEMLYRLPEDPWRYFLKTSDAILVELGDLKPIRAREKGIRNANKYMKMAYDGGKRRKPIDLKELKGGKYEVLDGNSTFANAKLSGWKRIPGIIKESDL